SEYYIECLTYFLVNFRTIFTPKLLKILPKIRYRVDKFIKVKNFLHEKLSESVRDRRKEIEKISNSKSFDSKLLNDDLLTSFLIANTPYESRPQKRVDSSLVRPMNDEEISSILFDTLTGSSDS
ncbi:7418_t:CDS:1, partial [Dentiscutata heterogama]